MALDAVKSVQFSYCCSTSMKAIEKRSLLSCTEREEKLKSYMRIDKYFTFNTKQTFPRNFCKQKRTQNISFSETSYR